MIEQPDNLHIRAFRMLKVCFFQFISLKATATKIKMGKIGEDADICWEDCVRSID